MLHAPVLSINSSMLRSAVAAQQIYPVFQPIVYLASGAISSFEVLARWQHPELGPVPPSKFIALAESSGQIPKLTASIIRQACREARDWGGHFRLTFNVSPVHFNQPDFPGFVEKAVVNTGFRLDRTQIEVTESAILEDITAARVAIRHLKERGVRIILDDFGTGFSSLTRLRELPFDKIKIDTSFVGQMLDDRESRKIVSAVIGLGQSLGLAVVAEGVESEAQAAMLKDLGCDYAQGWLFGRPAGAETVLPLIHERGEHAHEPGPLDRSQNQRLAHLEAIYQNAPVGLCFLDRQLRFISANQCYRNFMQASDVELIGRAFPELFPVIAKAASKDLHNVLDGGASISREVRLPGDGGRALLNTAPAKDEAGSVLGVSIALTPISR